MSPVGSVVLPSSLFVPRQSAIRSETLCHRLQFSRSLNEELNNGATSRFEAYLLITISQSCAWICTASSPFQRACLAEGHLT